MHEKEKIDALAYGAKWGVESLNCNQKDKQFANGVIDLTAESLKLAVTVKDAAVEHIRAAARLYNLDRVVVFPCSIEGKIQLCYRMHGGYIPAFCQQLGIRLFTNTDVQLNTIYISQMEQQYGVVLYDRNH